MKKTHKKKFNKHNYTIPDDKILENFNLLSSNQLATKDDIAKLLRTNKRALNLKLYVNPKSDLYTEKTITKKNGSKRVLKNLIHS